MHLLQCLDEVTEISGSLRARVTLLEPAQTSRRLRIDLYDAIGTAVKNWEYVWMAGQQELIADLIMPDQMITGLHSVRCRFDDTGGDAGDQILVLTKQQMRDRQHLLNSLAFFTFSDSGAIKNDLDVERLSKAAEELTEAGCYRASAGVWLRISSHWLPLSKRLAAYGGAQILINYYADESLPITYSSYYLDPCLALISHLALPASSLKQVAELRAHRGAPPSYSLEVFANLVRELNYNKGNWRDVLFTSLQYTPSATVGLCAITSQYRHKAIVALNTVLKLHLTQTTDSRLMSAIKQTLESIGVREVLIELPRILKDLTSEQQHLFHSLFNLTYPLFWIPDDMPQGAQLQHVMCRGTRYPVSREAFDLMRRSVHFSSVSDITCTLDQWEYV